MFSLPMTNNRGEKVGQQMNDVQNGFTAYDK